jgi:hypothetical protein
MTLLYRVVLLQSLLVCCFYFQPIVTVVLVPDHERAFHGIQICPVQCQSTNTTLLLSK